MPIYEYICGKCGGHLEVTQKMSDAPLTTHNIASDCGGPLKKIISMNSFHLKGTGWYKTDYAKPSSTGSSSSSDSSESKKENAKEGSESKSPASESSPAPTTTTTATTTTTTPSKTGGGGTD